MPNPFATLGLNCPDGGTFYVCQGKKVEFIGCCAVDPCVDGSGTCPEDDLRSASFNADKYKDIAPQECAESSALWYTCQAGDPPFLGCCSSNPCDSGVCPKGNLFPAMLSANAQAKSGFLTTPSDTSAAISSVTSSSSASSSGPTSSRTTTASTSTSSSTRAASSNTSSNTNTATNAASSSMTGPTDSPGSPLSAVVIGGFVVGIVVVISVIVVGCVCIFRRRARRKKESNSDTKSLMGSTFSDWTDNSSYDFESYRGANYSGLSHLKSFDYLQKTWYGRKARTNSPSLSYEPYTSPSQRSEADRNTTKVASSLLHPSLKTVSGLRSPKLTEPSRHELSAGREIRIFRGPEPVMTSPLAVPSKSRLGPASPLPRQGRNELHMWDGSAGRGPAQRESQDLEAMSKGSDGRFVADGVRWSMVTTQPQRGPDKGEIGVGIAL